MRSKSSQKTSHPARQTGVESAMACNRAGVTTDGSFPTAIKNLIGERTLPRDRSRTTADGPHGTKSVSSGVGTHDNLLRAQSELARTASSRSSSLSSSAIDELLGSDDDPFASAFADLRALLKLV